ncbi:Cytochrome P450 superfamily [Sesbania bispinosa]|nr:Cytochrome P450 superfamily [Sesbania bispinosa]
MAKEIMKTNDLAFAHRPRFLASDIMGYGSVDIAFAPYGSPINLTNKIDSFISTFVSRAAFGNISEDHEEFILIVKEATQLSDGFDLADLFPSLKPIHLITGLKAKLENMLKKLDKIIEKILKENQVYQMRANKGMGEEKNENLVEVLLRVLHKWQP